MHLQMTFGGPEALQAIAYIALTFFAHYFPGEAREDGLKPVKAFVQGQRENTFAWWESNATTEALPHNPFEFGHTIVLITVAETSEAFAVVSFFQALTVTVALGQLTSTTDRTMTAFLDPHAERAPDDIREVKSDLVELRPRKPEPLHENLEQMVTGGGGERLLQDLITKIERWHFLEEMSPVLDRLNAAGPLQGHARLDAIAMIVEGQTDRLYRLMKYVVDDFTAKSGQAGPALLVTAALQAQIALRDETPLPETEAATMLVTVAFVRELNDTLSRGPIAMDYLWELFSSGKGAALVGGVMFEPIMAKLEALADTLPEREAAGGGR